MKRLVIFILLLVSILCSYGLETIKVGFFQLEPYIIAGKEGEKPTGASVEYWEKYIAPKMNLQTEWVGPLPMLRMLKELETGSLDALVLLAKNPERTAKFLFPQNPYTIMKPSLVLLKENKLNKITKLDDLFDLKIGYVKGAFIPPFMVNDKIKIEYSQSENYKKDNFNKLELKRIDAILDVNEISNLYEAKKYNLSKKIKLLLLPTDSTGVYIVFPKSEKGQKLLKIYEQINNALYKSTAFEKIIAKYR